MKREEAIFLVEEIKSRLEMDYPVEEIYNIIEALSLSGEVKDTIIVNLWWSGGERHIETDANLDQLRVYYEEYVDIDGEDYNVSDFAEYIKNKGHFCRVIDDHVDVDMYF